MGGAPLPRRGEGGVPWLETYKSFETIFLK